jgi:hypothetical protein
MTRKGARLARAAVPLAAAAVSTVTLGSASAAPLHRRIESEDAARIKSLQVKTSLSGVEAVKGLPMVVTLDVRFFLYRTPAELLGVGISVRASLADLSRKAPLWDCRETVTAEETQAHPPAFYRSNDLPMLESLLVKVADRLADDIIYSR